MRERSTEGFQRILVFTEFKQLPRERYRMDSEQPLFQPMSIEDISLCLVDDARDHFATDVLHISRHGNKSSTSRL